MLEPENGSDPEIVEISRNDTTHRDLPKTKSTLLLTAVEWVTTQADETWNHLLKDHLWQRMLKVTLATTIAVIVALIPAVVRVYGKATYLGALTTVFGHPGRRFGQMAEALVLALLGTLIGTAWSTLGIYLSSLVYSTNEPAAYTIKALFLLVVVLSHGFLRSHTPRLFIMVLLMIIVSVVSLTGQSVAVSRTAVTTLLYPILTAIGILCIVNICVFPEFSSSSLGITTIQTLKDTVAALRDAGEYFIHPEALSQVHSKSNEQGQNLSNESPIAAKESVEGNPSQFPSLIVKVWQGMRVNMQKKKAPSAQGAKVPRIIKLKSLTDAKSSLRKSLGECRDAQDECNFELAFAVLPPRDLKPISDTAMTKLVANTVALIGICESKYALTGDQDDSDIAKELDHGKGAQSKGDAETSRRESLADASSADEKEKEDITVGKLEEHNKKMKGKTRLERQIAELELVKPRKEIEFGDISLLRMLIDRISKPARDLQEKIDRTVDVISCCLAYCYDVPKLPDGSRPPNGIRLDEIDIWADVLTYAIKKFDMDSKSALEGTTSNQSIGRLQIDVMPRVETFLISSFILNLRQAAMQIHHMLVDAQKLVEKRQARHDRRRVYAPKLEWRKWLISGGEMDEMALPTKGRKDARTGTIKETPRDDASMSSSIHLLRIISDEEALSQYPNTGAAKPATRSKPLVQKSRHQGTVSYRLRNHLADTIEWIVASEDVLYSLKLAIAVFLVIWPAFIAAWNPWYYENRGLWAALQLVLITEVSIGNSIFIFTLRAVGTTLGCVWGLAAYEAGDGDLVVCVVMLVIGIIPSAYVQLGTKYVKAGMISIVSMCIVALATEDQTVVGTAPENFLKRWIAFLIGGCVALIVEFVLLPVRARDRLVESLASSISHITEMEACLAYGIETEANVDVRKFKITERFDVAKSNAQTALTAAETFLPFCSKEPRLKGSFAGLALVYTEILYVLHQIVDKMDNMVQLRREYGSGVLEELNFQVFAYRRNLASSITMVLFAVHEALTTKLPLPQFLPSARLAHLRMINRVRDVVLNSGTKSMIDLSVDKDQNGNSGVSELELSLVKRIVQQKFLSWNAAAGGQTEIIEYLEELVDLTKLLVGANEFRSGMFMRPTFREYVAHIGQNSETHATELNTNLQRGEQLVEPIIQREQAELKNKLPKPLQARTVRRRTANKGDDQTGYISGTSNMQSKYEVKKAEEEELPRSLQRVRTRRVEQRMGRPERFVSRDKKA